MNLTGSQAVLEALIQEKVDLIFGYPGGAIMPLYDALHDYHDKIRHILVRHEQGASHAAEGYARITGRPGVCFATSGPGATNLVTGIADAMMDSVPLVCITGQVAAQFVGTDAFQETDIVGITTPITKWNYQVSDAEEIPMALAKAFYIARTGRPGPVLIDITKNAQFQKFDFHYPKSVSLPGYSPHSKPDMQKIKQAAALLNKSKKPLVFVGHGILISKAQNELTEFLEKGGYPFASTLHGLSSIPTAHPQYTGMLGMHGNYGPNMLTNKADVIIAIGMRFDDRVTGRLSHYAKQAKIIHIDIDSSEHNKNVPVDVAINADAKEALRALIPHIRRKNHFSWLHEFRIKASEEYEKVTSRELSKKTPKMTMVEVIKKLSDKTKGEAIIVADVGQHQMVAARYYEFSQTDSFVTSGGSGTMGFALPAAIGAKLATSKREVIAIIGDGSFQMTIQELGTIAQEKLPVKIIILNNHFLGMVRQWQQMFFDKRYSFTELKNPNFVAISKGFGIPAQKVLKRKDLSKALDKLLSSKGPFLLDIDVEKEVNVFPMMPTGASVDEMRLE